MLIRWQEFSLVPASPSFSPLGEDVWRAQRVEFRGEVVDLSGVHYQISQSVQGKLS